MSSSVRTYRRADYKEIENLYRNSDLYGGQFDHHRDSEERLSQKIKADPDSILVCEQNGRIVGSVSLIEETRVAWLFRFAVVRQENEKEIAAALYERAVKTLKNRGHHQVLLYAPEGNSALEKRYVDLGLTKGGVYRCFWADI